MSGAVVNALIGGYVVLQFSLRFNLVLNVYGNYIENENEYKLAKCVVPEKIHTHPMGGHWKFLGGGESFEAMYEDKPEFPGGRGDAKQKTFHGGGSMDIFWNCTIK